MKRSCTRLNNNANSNEFNAEALKIRKVGTYPMKKLISLLLAVMMLASMASFAAAEEEKTLVFIS